MPDPKHPLHAHEHAVSQIQYIRSAIDGAVRFTAVPGKGTAAMGASALVAAAIANSRATPDEMLLVWVYEAAVAISIGLVALYLKARSAGIDLARGAARKFLLALLPSGICSAALSLAMAAHHQP